LIQLQAAYKLYDRDGEKSRVILKKSIEGLSESVTLLRDTVHSIKLNENLGVEYLKKIIDNFSFCPVDIQFNGDFNKIPPNHMEILGTNIKEALTNASKYSKASKVEIKIDSNEMFTRLYIKDNGIGCDKIKEGLGLSGMEERIRNIGGTMSVSSDNGFLIVCIIPKDDVGGAIFESAGS
jgi:signal transduction histidine kinase